VSRSVLVLATLFAFLLGSGFFAFSATSHDDSSARHIQEEVLFGTYWCSVGLSDGYLWLDFNATGDVLNKETFISRAVTVSSTPAEICEFYSSETLDSLSSQPCTISEVEISADDTGESRSFQFVCRAARATIIRTMAGASEVLLTSAP
jgi:hypothetical protein